ncbi:MAG: DinB family protein [Anaerolineaceae bacterium]|nr:DinB family protein [Anaerolineaceae bacterium]
MPHPIVLQLRFTRKEFFRSVKTVSNQDAMIRIQPMNCLSWNVGHLAWQEQRYFLHYGQGKILFPDIDKEFAYGSPASTPIFQDVLTAWQTITKTVDPWLDTLNSEQLIAPIMSNGKPIRYTFGNLLLRTIYHYWYHTGENMAIRQQLGHTKLPVLVGNIDTQAPYIPENL